MFSALEDKNRQKFIAFVSFQKSATGRDVMIKINTNLSLERLHRRKVERTNYKETYEDFLREMEEF